MSVAESISMRAASFINGMAVVHRIAEDKKTRAEIATSVLLLALAGNIRRVDIIL